MKQGWTFGRKLATGFALTTALAVVLGAVAIVALRSAVTSKDEVITVHVELLLNAERMRSGTEWKVASQRGYLLTRDEAALGHSRDAQDEIENALAAMRRLGTDERRAALDGIERVVHEHQAAFDEIIAMRRSEGNLDAVAKAFEDKVMPVRETMRARLNEFVNREQAALEDARQASNAVASSAIATVTGVVMAIVVSAVVLAVVLTRSLTRQIGAAIGRVQSSSAELQSAATQQATGARQQAGAMNEISTTISELLATSRQIAESAQRVALIANETASSARSGEGTVTRTQDSIGAIHRQVDLIVNHMLDLGKKSQQIGAVLEIVSELAEQTNILAINATIEAVGAGDAGKRFTVVADEIRKLADRVTTATKEIRALIDDVRSAVNVTVMTTETGSKAVDAGARQFTEVTSAFGQIVGLVSTTTEASREIELSTKQQATAVEQVKLAIASVAQATKETEASSQQTLQTASQLAGLSKDLLQLIRADASQAA